VEHKTREQVAVDAATAHIAQVVRIMAPVVQQFKNGLMNLADVAGAAFRGMSEAMYPIGDVVKQVRDMQERRALRSAARARGRHRRELIDRIARERGVRPSEIRRKVAAIRAQH
jgi:hypothetical protein